MRQQHKIFQAIEVGDGGDGRWAAYARALWQEMEGLLTEEGRTPRGADRVRALFGAHMPELVPVLHRLAGQLDRSGAEAFLTHAALRPFTRSPSPAGSGSGSGAASVRRVRARVRRVRGHGGKTTQLLYGRRGVGARGRRAGRGWPGAGGAGLRVGAG